MSHQHRGFFPSAGPDCYGNAVIAQDNRFNRWVAGEGAAYFSGAEGFASCMDALQANPALLGQLRTQGQRRFAQEFTWPHVLRQYEELLTRFLSG